jgi:hypothetical protein
MVEHSISKIVKLFLIISSFAYASEAISKQCLSKEDIYQTNIIQDFLLAEKSNQSNWDFTLNSNINENIVIQISSNTDTSLNQMDAVFYRRHTAAAQRKSVNLFEKAGFIQKTDISMPDSFSWSTSFQNGSIIIYLLSTRITNECNVFISFSHPFDMYKYTMIDRIHNDITDFISRTRYGEKLMLKDDKILPSGLAPIITILLALPFIGLAVALASIKTKWHLDVYLTLYQKIAVSVPSLIGSIYASISILFYIMDRHSIENSELALCAMINIFTTTTWLTSFERHQSLSLLTMFVPHLLIAILYVLMDWSWIDGPIIIWALGNLSAIIIATRLFKKQAKEHYFQEKIAEKFK